ncbi:MAG TPA: hypothetical protein VK777_25390, partial [Reyranella sp.]|nr:hypothetical protein [Reyranella sp.]
MAAPKLDAETFERWVAAPMVFEQLGDFGSRISGVNALIDRLQAGLCHAAAEQFAVNMRPLEGGPFLIPKGHWPTKGMYDNEMWQTAQLSFSL